MEPSYLFNPLQRSGHYMYHLLERLKLCILPTQWVLYDSRKENRLFHAWAKLVSFFTEMHRISVQ